MTPTKEQIEQAQKYIAESMLFDRSYFAASDQTALDDLENKLMYMVEQLAAKPGRLSQTEMDIIIDHLIELNKTPDLVVYQFLTMLNTIVFMTNELAHVYRSMQAAMTGQADIVAPTTNRVGGYL